jgi:hypothetical protein
LIHLTLQQKSSSSCLRTFNPVATMRLHEEKSHVDDDNSSLSSSIGKEQPQFEDLQAPSEQRSPQQPQQHDSIRRLPTNRTHRSTFSQHRLDESDLVNLPFRTLSNDADIQEYTAETIDGQILKEVKSNKTGRIERFELVTWTINDPENPKNWSKPYKWWCTMMVAITCFCVAFNSAVVTADIKGPAEEFGVSEEVALLSITLFVVGFGVGE